MKRSLLILILLFVFSCNSEKKELFDITDSLVESLQTTYESYGVLGGNEHEKTTKDGLYRVKPIGRLINVKILKPVEDDVYEELKLELKNHYEGNSSVNDVYINNGGTIMIDCRN
jgi:hypothetical protein